MFSSLWECIYSKGFRLLTDLWTAVNLGIRLWFLRVRERSGIKPRVRPSRQCGTKKSTEVSKGQLEDQGWGEWKERDHASARCQASRVGFKLGQAADTRSMPSFKPQTNTVKGEILPRLPFIPARNSWLVFPENQHPLFGYPHHCFYVLKNNEKTSRIVFLIQMSLRFYLWSDLSWVSYFQKPAVPRGFAVTSSWQQLINSSLEFCISVYSFNEMYQVATW